MTITASSRYKRLENKRRPFLDRAKDAAKLTIPSLIPPDDHTSETKYETPFQDMGARGTNNLSSKLLLAILPPNTPFFRYVIDDFALNELAQREGARAEVEKALNVIERSVLTWIEGNSVRVTTMEALKHLMVAGNSLVHLPDEGGIRLYPLSRYVVVRDPVGNVLEIITKDAISYEALPEAIKEIVNSHDSVPEAKDKRDDPEHKVYDLYTRVIREGTLFKYHQEIEDVIVPGSLGSVPVESAPWIALRWSKIDGEDYGRGYIEEYYGDLRSLEALTQAIVEGSAAAAKVLFLVNPNGTTKMKTVAEAPNGAVRPGNATDVTVLQMEKFGDFRIAQETADKIERRLSYSFLLNTSVQRSGERVTAEEIRYMAGELEDALGGVYSILANEYQLPLVNCIIASLERKKLLPKLPKDLMRPAITTGLEALGRGHDLNKLQLFAENLAKFGEAGYAVLNMDDYITRVGTALGIDMNGLVKSKEQLAAEQQAQMQQAAMQQMIDKLGPGAMNIARDQMAPSNEAPNGPPQ